MNFARLAIDFCKIGFLRPKNAIISFSEACFLRGTFHSIRNTMNIYSFCKSIHGRAGRLRYEALGRPAFTMDKALAGFGLWTRQDTPDWIGRIALFPTLLYIVLIQENIAETVRGILRVLSPEENGSVQRTACPNGTARTGINELARLQYVGKTFSGASAENIECFFAQIKWLSFKK